MSFSENYNKLRKERIARQASQLQAAQQQQDALNAQYRAEFADPSAKEDYAEKSQYVSTAKDQNWLDKLTGTTRYGDRVYEYINGANNGVRKEIFDAMARSADSGTAGGELEYFSTLNHMTDDQIRAYNYHYATGGKETAQKYLDSIQESLNQQEAERQFQKIEGKTGQELLYGVPAGINQAAEGLKNAFNFSDDYIPQDVTQFVSGMAREDLSDDGPNLPDWLGGASLGQAGYDAISSISNMAPSMLVSIATGPVVGTGMLGVSAAGNAYQEKLNQGYSKGQARVYSTLIGASEATLQYLLGGISKLSGANNLSKAALNGLSKMDNVLARVAVKVGTSAGGKILSGAVSEGFEEGLQSILDPFLWSIISGEEMDVSKEEALYSALLGFFTGGIFETVEAAGTKQNASAQQPQQSTSLVDDIVDRITTPSTQNAAQEAQQDAQKPQKIDIAEIMDEVVANATGAPADPVGVAVEAFKATGTVTDKQATDIMNSVKAVTQLVEQTGVKLPEDKTQRRAAVKQVVADLAQKQSTPPVDTTTQTDYDNKNTQGGTVHADTYTQGESLHSGGVRWNPQGNSQGETAPGAGNGSIYAGSSSQSGASGAGNRGNVHTADSEGRALTPEQTVADLAQKNAAQTGGAKYQLLEYSQHQKENWKNSKRIVLYEGIEHFKQFIKNALSGDAQTNKKLYFGAIPTDLANAIADSTGVNVDGYNLSLAENEIRKINKSHGNESTEAPRGQRAVTEADYLNIPNIVQSPDSITLSSKLYEGKPVIEFRKTNGNETSVVAAVVSDKRLDLFVQTTFVNKKTGSIATPEPVQADSFTPKATGGTAPHEAESTQAGESPKTGSLATPKDSASGNNIPQPDGNVNTQNKTHPAPDESVGAAPAGFDPISHLQYEYGTIPEGENPVRPDDMPKSTDGKDRVSYTARTVKGAKVTPDEFVDLLNKEVAEGGLSYIPITNNATTQAAIDHISNVGWEEAKKTWSADVYKGKAGADMSAVGALLLNNAAKAGDKTAWLEILHDYQRMGTNTAQGLQALRILKKLEPMDKLYMIDQSVKQMAKDMQVDVTLDEDLLHEFENAKTDEARDKALVKIQQSVADQIPSTFMEKWTALRYVNMLGNLRTQVRNVAGNLGMKAVSSVKNTIATGLEQIASAASGGKLERTKSFTVSKAQMEAGKADFDRFKSMVLGGGKYADSRTASEEFAQGVQDKRTIFKFKPLEGYRKVTGLAMEKGDVIFSRPAYARALAGYLKAHGVTQTDYSKVDAALMDNARLYAAQEAQEQTFRDSNALSDWISKVGRRKDTPAAVKAISEGVMPFRKTPANVLIRAEEYSPLGIINSVYYSIKAAQNGSNVTGAQVINSWAKTLTGSGIFVLGMLLSNLGILAGGPDEDENKEDFESLNGWQNYAIVLPDGTNITIDWLSPSAMPMLMGAQLMELIQDGGFELKDLEKALLSIADPMVEMSMLQGINDTLENVRYADSNLGQFAVNAALSYLTQGLTNTFLGQMERTFEDSRMTTYVDKDSPLPDWLQRTLGKASAKTPRLDYNQIPYINAWGEEEENPHWALNGLYNTLSPGYIEKGASDALTQELNRLNSAQGDRNVYPSTPDKTITIGGEKRNLSAEEYVALAKAQGQTAKRLVKDIIKSEYYDGLSDQQKAAAISYAYDYAREYARVETLEDYTEYSAKWMEGLDGNATEAILRKVAVGSADKFTDIPIDSASYISDLLDSIMPETGYSSTRYVQRVETITGSDLTEEQQKQIMDEVLDDAAYDKYLKILDKGYSNDDYAAALRIYLDAEKTSTRTKKQVIIQEFVDELNLTRVEAEVLYKLYSGAQ